MSLDHPVTPPSRLIELLSGLPTTEAIKAAVVWGANQELEACCAFAHVEKCCGTKFQRRILVRKLREHRRPKRVSLKEQALMRCTETNDPDGVIRRALETIPDEINYEHT